MYSKMWQFITLAYSNEALHIELIPFMVKFVLVDATQKKWYHQHYVNYTIKSA